MNQSVVVGVSGGVDSAVTLLTLRQEGWKVYPVYLKMKEGLESLDQARLERLEEVTGLPVEVVDCRKAFCAHVTDPFVEALKEGLTPNPCVWCNQHVKMKLLFDAADSFGCHYVSTGHYARIIPGPEGKPALARAQSSKDQSYMLYRIDPRWVERLMFRLGSSEKEGVRAYARQALGEGYGGGDSQDICFLGEESLDCYIDARLAQEPGAMVTPDGQVLGQHKGLAHYTLGQRKGLGLNKGPWFVVGKKEETNELVLAHEPAQVTRLVLTQPRLLLPLQGSLTVKTRYRGAAVACSANHEGEKLVIDLAQPMSGVAPGQSAVLYQGDYVVGGGFIAKEGIQ